MDDYVRTLVGENHVGTGIAWTSSFLQVFIAELRTRFNNSIPCDGESVVSLRGMKKTREDFVVILVYFSSLHILWKCSFEN